MSKNRRIDTTTGTFTGTSYHVAGDPIPTSFTTREEAEQRAERLDSLAAIADAYRDVDRNSG